MQLRVLINRWSVSASSEPCHAAVIIQFMFVPHHCGNLCPGRNLKKCKPVWRFVIVSISAGFCGFSAGDNVINDPLKTNLEMELTILGLNCYCCYCMSRSNCFTKTCANDWTNMFNRHLTKCVGKLKSEICRPFLLCANKQTEPCKTAVGFIQFPKYLDVRSIEILLYSMAL